MNNVTKRSGGTPPSNSFRLDKTNAKLAGVCGGIANYANIDPMLVRVGFVIGAFVSLGTAALIYLAIALIAD
ncbi:MAG: PspC domain-containing protein [Erythrobacter sp.]|nr:PspC domain-containing protein [Erythrobacter sp.]